MKSRFASDSSKCRTVARSVAAACALSCAALASAQGITPSTVTLYGIADVGITTTTGLKAGSVTQVASGIMEGSRWGLKGNEDLGGGYRAVFTMEGRIEVDTGGISNKPISGNQLSDRYSQAALLGLPAALQPAVTAIDALVAQEFGANVGAAGNRLFDRQAFVGLVTPFGAFLAGRQYSLGVESASTYDIMGGQSALSSAQIVAFPTIFEFRQSNSLVYRLQKGGISGALMYAAGEVAGASRNGRTLGINGTYKAGGFSGGFAYTTKNNELGQKSQTIGLLGASMNFGPGTVSSFVSKISDDNPSSLSGISAALAPAVGAVNAAAVQTAFINAFKQDGTLFHMGYRYITGPSTVSVAYSRYNDHRPANADVASYGVAYSYALSKRTDLNAVLARFDNKNLAQVAPGGNGYLGGVTASAGTGSTSLAFGIRHRF